MSDAEVCIVGAGPTGLTLALLLARRGVSVIVAEREADLYPLPRAAHVDHQIMRVFQELGLAEAIMATCRHASRYDFLSAAGEVLLRFDGADRIAAGGWPAGNMIHQPSIERELRLAVTAQPGLELRSGWRFRTLADAGGEVRARFDTPDGEAALACRYLIGADGARSAVREALSGGVDDLGFDEPWLVVDALVRDGSRLPDVNLQICDPARPTTCCVMGAGRHRWEFMIKPGEAREALLRDDAVADLLEPWNVAGAIAIERKAVYRFAARIAGRWREGRMLLAGDAAHQMPPFAGQGLCSGIRDAHNLAWKLAAVLAGRADDGILDSYQLEREPNVRAITGMAIMMGRTVCITDPAAAAERDRQMLAAAADGAGARSGPAYPDIAAGLIATGTPAAGDYFPQPLAGGTKLDDVLGPEAWLLSRAPTGRLFGTDVGVASLGEPMLQPFAAQLRGWLDKHAAEAVLVRPDRYVFGTGAPDRLLAMYGEALALEAVAA